TWTIDTLSYPGSLQTTMRDMYAVNEKDIYVVGHNEDNGVGTMYHYDGKKWSPVKLSWAVGGNISGAFDLSAIYGFGANDIYAVGFRYHDNPTPPPNYIDSSLIIHYDGTQWREVKPDVRGRGNLQGIWGSAPNDIWTGGTYGALYHYDGNIWNKINADTSLWFSDFGGNKSEQYALAYNRKDTSGYLTTIHYLLSYKQTNWTKIEQFAELPNSIWTFGHSSIRFIDGQFYSAGYGVFKKKNNSWEKLFDSGERVFLSVLGTRKKNIFALGLFGEVYHFNGEEWKLLPKFDNLENSLTSGWTDEKEVFILGNSNYKTYIYHGK
ncbi:MAG: hypothetical protein AAB071_05960, partial [Bacteroidota bacterium]